jgi:hypothetical protein
MIPFQLPKMACDAVFNIRNLSSVSSGPFALKLHFHLELSRLPRVLMGGRSSQARTAGFEVVPVGFRPSTYTGSSS